MTDRMGAVGGVHHAPPAPGPAFGKPLVAKLSIVLVGGAAGHRRFTLPTHLAALKSG
jgi:hypothetical protein